MKGILGQGLLNPENLSEEQSCKIFDILFELMLEIKNSGEEKSPGDFLMNVMDFLLKLSPRIPQNSLNSQRVLLIVFNQGIGLVQKNQIDASKKKFDECI